MTDVPLKSRAERKAAREANRAVWAAKRVEREHRNPMQWAKAEEPKAVAVAPKPRGRPAAPAEEGDFLPPDYWAGLAQVVGAGGGGPLLLERAAQFEQLLDMSLARATDVMSIDLKAMDPADKNFQKIMSTQQSIMASVFSTTARIDDAKLRAKQTDLMDEVLEAVRRHDHQPRLAGPAPVDAVFEEVAADDEEAIRRELMGE